MDDSEKYKKEILKAEADFANRVVEIGMRDAFIEFADEDAVLNRNGEFFKGKAAIKAYLDNITLRNIELSWTPDFIGVSKDGDMAYTYGKYSFAGVDKEGVSHQSAGNFHTVWKRQEDGSWKYVWD